VQVIIALIVTPEGFPVAYEVMPGNTSDKTTLPDFLCKIQKQYGKMNRLWIMDRDIPTEEALEQMRTEGASYLVGTPRGRLAKLEKELFAEPWKAVQEQIEVKARPRRRRPLRRSPAAPADATRNSPCAAADSRNSGNGCTKSAT
jgi:transposase